MIRKAKAVWRGTGRAGSGNLSTDSGVLAETPYSFKTRFENEKGTNPEATGFDLGEIDFRIVLLLAPASEPTEPPIPAVSGPAVSQAGDLWLLGEHRVLCGSALDAASYRALAPYRGAARRGTGQCARVDQSLRLDAAQCRNGELLPLAT